MSLVRAQIHFVVSICEIERLGQFTGPGTESSQIFDAAPSSHQLNAAPRLQRANQYKTVTRTFYEHVQHPVGAVTKIDISSACPVSFNKCAGARTHKCVASFVVFRQVGFGFDDDSSATTPMQSRADQVTRTTHRLPLEKGSTDDLAPRIAIRSISKRNAWSLQGQCC